MSLTLRLLFFSQYKIGNTKNRSIDGRRRKNDGAKPHCVSLHEISLAGSLWGVFWHNRNMRWNGNLLLFSLFPFRKQFSCLFYIDNIFLCQPYLTIPIIHFMCYLFVITKLIFWLHHKRFCLLVYLCEFRIIISNKPFTEATKAICSKYLWKTEFNLNCFRQVLQFDFEFKRHYKTFFVFILHTTLVT